MTGQELQIRGDDGTIQGARGLTEQQRALIVSFAALGSVTAAAHEVGCRADQAGRTLRLAHVQAALRGECQAMLARAAPIAVGALLAIVEDPDLKKTRLGLDAAKTLLDRVGLGPMKAGEGQGDGKRDLSDLSMAELAAFIRQGQERQRQALAVDTEGSISAPEHQGPARKADLSMVNG